MTFPYDEFDLSGVRTYPLAARESKVRVADFAKPVKSNMPTLIFSGGMDPVTPPAYGVEVAKDLPNGRHIVAPGYGHIVSHHACGPRLVATFVDDASTSKLSASCISYFEKSVMPPLFDNRLAQSP